MKANITIIMPSLNVVNYIEECLKSVVNQTYKDIEVICIDAGSTDGTLEILEQYVKIDKRIKIVHSTVKSYGAQVNMGIRLAEGKYIGIVETDDYIKADMYQKLIELGERNDLDYIKADYEAFRALNLQEERLFFSNKSFEGKEKKNYYQIVNAKIINNIFEKDYSIWRGIYKKEFLEKYSITCSETQGAAYQDIGFTFKVIMNAEKAMYIDESYYRYRLDRENASTYSLKALNNCLYEYRQLHIYLEENRCNDECVWRGYYMRVVGSFIVEYEKILRAVKYEYANEHLLYSYKWFIGEIEMGVRKGFIDTSEIDNDIWEKYCAIKDDDVLFAKKVKSEDNEKKERICRLREKPIVIFGCGTWGKKAFVLCKENEIKVIGFSDNSEQLWGKRICETSIYPPQICVEQFQDIIYLVANKKQGNIITEQLVSLGIDKKRIVNYEEISYGV